MYNLNLNDDEYSAVGDHFSHNMIIIRKGDAAVIRCESCEKDLLSIDKKREVEQIVERF